MSSTKGMQRRKEAAQARIDAALSAIGSELSLDLGDFPLVDTPTIQHDLEIQVVLQREWLANTFETLNTSLGEAA